MERVLDVRDYRWSAKAEKKALLHEGTFKNFSSKGPFTQTLFSYHF